MTLTETASLTKKLIILSVILSIALIGGGIWFQIYQRNRPKPPPVEEKPDVLWSILPKPNLPLTSVSSANYSYTLDTTTGSVPKDLPKIMKVYFIPQLGTTLLAADKARELAADFKFTNGPDILSNTKYRFTDEGGGEFIVDLSSSNFQYKHSIATDSPLLQDETLGDESRIKTDFMSYLRRKNLLREGLSEGRVKISFNKSTPKESSSAAISLWQEDVDGHEIITDRFTKGLINGVVTKFKDELQKFLELEYIFWPIDQTNFSTYPIKNAEVAFTRLQNGQGAVVIEPKKAQVSINKIGLVYFLSEDYSQYLQPVFLFEGEQFAALVPAITDEYLQK
ncbi:hypothetical protein HYW46_05025 [Candidatus Daviesbacteria bacterium]|nr:hypothetical protein [Candidatus Daviesbacteria bacterium]